MILVTGGAGQVATELAQRADLVRVGRPEFDFDRPDTVEAAFRHRPDLVVNAAAWTAVDAAEQPPAAAARANCSGPAPLALVAAGGRYALVVDGTAGDPPVAAGLDAAEARLLLPTILRPDRRP